MFDKIYATLLTTVICR